MGVESLLKYTLCCETLTWDREQALFLILFRDTTVKCIKRENVHLVRQKMGDRFLFLRHLLVSAVRDQSCLCHQNLTGETKVWPRSFQCTHQKAEQFHSIYFYVLSHLNNPPRSHATAIPHFVAPTYV